MNLLGTLILTICSLSTPDKSHHHSDTLTSTKNSLKLDSLIQQIPFKLNNNSFSGVGWDLLTTESQKAHIVLIGEQHGEAEIPVFTTQLAKVFKPKALITEIDPYTAIELKRVSVNPSGYSAYFKQYPYAFAFYSWQTEMELVRQMQLSHVDIWGLNEIE